MSQSDTGYFAQDLLTAGRGIRIRKNGAPTTTYPALAVDTTTGADGDLFNVKWNGYVGIGTTNPGQKLEVNGNIKTTTDNALPNLVLDSSGAGDNWTSQGAYISIGESGALGSASMHLTYTGDGYGYSGAGTVGPTTGIPAGGHWRYTYNTANIYTPSTVTVAGSIVSSSNIQAAGTVTSGGNSWTGSSTWNTFSTAYGSIQLGPANGSWAHIYSTLPFYFNQGITSTGTVTAPTFSGDLSGNASTVTNGVYLSSGYIQSPSWISMNGNSTGLYWPGWSVANYGVTPYLYPNYAQSYGAFTVQGYRNSYVGINWYNASGTVGGMFDTAGNGGDYDTTTGWHYYWNRANSSLGIGGSTTAAGYKMYVNGNSYHAGDAVVTGTVSINTANASALSYTRSGYTGVLNNAGNGYFALGIGSGYMQAYTGGAVGGSAAWTNWSDIRLKKNINTITDPLSIISQLRGVSFNWKDLRRDQKTEYGFIAQEVEKVLPSISTEMSNGIDEKDKTKYKSIAPSEIIPFLVEGIKEQQTEIEDLKSKLEDQQHQIDELKQAIQELKK